MTSTGLLVFARCAGVISRAPGFSHPAVPPPARAALALGFAVAIAPTVRAVRLHGEVFFVVALATEFAVGAAIGVAASLLYDGAYAGGRALDDYVGIRGSVPNAQIFASSAFGRIWSLVFTAGFFLFGGYRWILAALARSFERLPLASVPSSHALFAFALSLPVAIVEAALLVAAPAIALVFVAQVTLGALTRVIPRFASFTLSFPIVFGTALAATLLAVPLLLPQSAIPWLRVPFLAGP